MITVWWFSKHSAHGKQTQCTVSKHSAHGKQEYSILEILQSQVNQCQKFTDILMISVSIASFSRYNIMYDKQSIKTQ